MHDKSGAGVAMGKNRKKRNVYPDLAQRLPHPIVDNHTHLPVSGDRDYAEFAQKAETAALQNGVEAIGETGDSAGVPQEVVSPGGSPRQGSIAWHVARMAEANVRHAITCGCEVPTLEATVRLAQEWDELSAAIGIHPNEAPLHCGITEESPDGMNHGLDVWHREYSLEEAVGLVADAARDPHVVAIGETGLDYFRTAEAGKEAQMESFRMHIALAKELDVALQIHDREAHADCIRILRECGAPDRTVFHCFSGDKEMAEICASEGWYASFAGPITYPANDYLRQAFLAMPEELILVETDAPYLTPVPWRGHPNAPYASAYTALYQAEIRGCDAWDWCARLDANTSEVYGL